MNDRERAAQLWCLPQHSHKEMDADFAESIAAEFAAVRTPLEQRIATLEAALGKLEREEISGRENEEGEDYLVCTRCDAQDWGSLDVYESGEMEHRADCVFAALSGAVSGDTPQSRGDATQEVKP